MPLLRDVMQREWFADVIEELEKQFAPAKFTSNTASQAVFPQSCSKRLGKSQHSFIFGIKPVTCDTQMTSSQVSYNHAALLELNKPKTRSCRNGKFQK